MGACLCISNAVHCCVNAILRCSNATLALLILILLALFLCNILILLEALCFCFNRRFNTRDIIIAAKTTFPSAIASLEHFKSSKKKVNKRSRLDAESAFVSRVMTQNRDIPFLKRTLWMQCGRDKDGLKRFKFSRLH